MDGHAYVLESNLADTIAPTALLGLTSSAFDFQEIDLNGEQSTDNNYVDH